MHFYNTKPACTSPQTRLTADPTSLKSRTAWLCLSKIQSISKASCNKNILLQKKQQKTKNGDLGLRVFPNSELRENPNDWGKP
jgi:hypothetical protein